MERRGHFITFEGIEGCGKSTQIARLSHSLGVAGLAHHLTKEPGGTAIGAEIRRTLLNSDHAHMAPACEAFLYLADRAQHVAEVVRPKLEAGVWVLCDRYHDSTRAYQGAARGLERPQLDAMFELATGGLLPDLTIVLDLDVATGLARARARNAEAQATRAEGRMEAEEARFHQAVRDYFLALAEEESGRFAVIDADRGMDEIAADIRVLLRDRLEVAFV